MMGVKVVWVVAALVLVGVTLLRTRRYPAGGRDPYAPGRSWLRAMQYFAACWMVSAASGTLQRIIDDPLVTDAQRSDTAWWMWAAGCVVLIVVAYSVVWARYTLTFDRPRRWAGQLLFGILWGTGAGQLLASYWVLFDRTGSPRWVVWLGTVAAISIWQGLWQDLYWDVYVTPEHDTPATITRKVVASHVPNVVVTVTFLTLYRNVALYVLMQTLALCSASLAMRFPAWDESRRIDPATTGPGPFGLLRCVGYETDDPSPYRTQRLTRRAAS